VLRAELQISSGITDELGQYQQYLLGLLDKGKNIDQISSIIQFEIQYVKQEILYLTQKGLVEEKSEDEYILTDLGKEKCKFVNSIYEFNERHVKVLINATTGKIVHYRDDLKGKEELTPDIPILNNRIVPHLYQNLNPENAKEYLLENYRFELLDADDLQEINVQLRYETRVVYALNRIKRSPVLLEKETITNIENKDFPVTNETENKAKNRRSGQIPVRGTVFPLNLRVEITSIDTYRKDISRIIELALSYPDLFVPEVLRIISTFEEENKLNEQLYLVYIDSVSGKVASSHLPHESDRGLVEIPVQIPVKDKVKANLQAIAEGILQRELDPESVRITCEVKNPVYAVKKVAIEDIMD